MSKKVIVLDLDETLGHTFNNIDGLTDLISQDSHKCLSERSKCYIFSFYSEKHEKFEHMWGIKRPGLSEFLDTCFAYYDIVIVWTAATADYAKYMVKALFGSRSPHYLFSREHCYKYAGETTKPLKLLFQYAPELKKMTTMDKIVMVDDRMMNFKLNIRNGLVIKAFEPDESMKLEDIDDKELYSMEKKIKMMAEQMEV